MLSGPGSASNPGVERAAIQLDATGVMGEIVILTSSRRVAAWAHEVAHERGDFGSRFELTPLVLPIVDKAIDALLDEAHPELAFFAARPSRPARSPDRRSGGRAHRAYAGRVAGRRRAAIVAVLKEPVLEYLKAIAMNPDQLPESRAARRFRQFFEDPLQRVEGRAAFRRVNELILERCSHVRIEDLVAIGDETRVMTTWTMIFRARIGPELRIPGSSELRIHGGRFVYHRDYWDILGAVMSGCSRWSSRSTAR
jgi:hypothetical protein